MAIMDINQGIYHIYSEYLETHVEIGLAGNRVVSLSFKDNPAGEESKEGIMEDITKYLEGEDIDLTRHRTALTVTGVERDALEAVKDIPRGSTMTYEEVARSIGRTEEADIVRAAITSNPIPIIIPCHRVIADDGIGGYPTSHEIKRRLMDLEGIQR